VGVLALGAGLYLLFRPEGGTETLSEAELADLYDRGDIEITGTAGLLPDPPGRSGGRRGGGRSAGGGGAAAPGGLSYEEAMNRVVDLGSADQSGGERRLTAGDVQGVMNRNINRFFSCVSAELRRGGEIRSVQIDLAIAGDGSVIGASTRQGSGTFQSCIASKVRSVRFPSFSSPRMGARYAFSVD
jgi:hypothetical protein